MYVASNATAMAVFPSLTTTLAGATVTGVWAYVYYSYWSSAAGGTAYIGLHGQNAVTATKPALSYVNYMTSTNWPQASGRWVQIDASTYGGWASGTHKGFTIGGYGDANEAGTAQSPQLRITYTK
jgi:hypothetical protein